MSKRKASDQSSSSSSSSSSSAAAAVVVDVDASPGVNEKRAKCLDEIHAHLICPITHKLMVDPVLAEDGNTYERSAIEQWIRSKGTSPLIPGQRLKIDRLAGNRIVTSTTSALVESGGCDAELAKSWKEAKKKADLVLAERHFAEGRVLEAAKMGLPKAQGVIAHRCFAGIDDGVAEDPDQGFLWAKKAAEGGDEQGQYYLGWAHSEGLGTAEDNVAALKWYELAASSPANSSYSDACYNIGHIYEGGGPGVVCDYSKAASWYLKGAEAGDSTAQNQLGLYYKDGLVVPKDLAAARSWFKKSAFTKNPRAMFEYGSMLLHGTAGTQDMRAGLELLIRSSERGDEKATELLQQFSDLAAPL